MAGGDELVRVARNKKCYIKISTTEHCARTVLSIHALEKIKINTQLHFSRKDIFLEKNNFTHIFLILDRKIDR